MNYLVVLLSKFVCLASIFLGSTFLLGDEWKKEVLNCGGQVCFVLHGEEEAMILGSLLWAREAVEGGKEMFYDRYFYEGVSLKDETGDELHIYGPILEQTGQEWADTVPGVSFSDYVLAKQGWDAEFANTIDGANVRYFTDEEREQTRVHWLNGALWQAGLDSEQQEITQVPEGVYAFALGNEQLFITPKIVTEKGRIQHSSFLRGGPVSSAGKIQVGADGNIVWLSNDSGHYRPGDPEIAEALRYVYSQMPKSFFKRIWVRNKPSEAWNTNPAFLRDYDSSEIDRDNDVPVMKWLRTFKKSGSRDLED